jgi:signal transduction protein with GAF and PtsI domain
LFPPLGWIISTGLYTDQIDAAIALKKEALSKQITQIIILIGGITLAILIIGLIVSFYFSKQLTQAVLSIQEKLKQLSLGEQVEESKTNRKDEVAEIVYSLNALVTGLKTYTAFTKEIGQGNLTQSFEPLSEKDVLGTELLQMRNNLKKANDEKNIRDWTNERLAMLSDVLRKNNSDTHTLGDEILRALVSYLKVNQGSLFFMKEDDQNNRYLELVATYAYDRKKFVTKQVAIGDGLIGQCVLDRHVTYLTAVPKDYINITSGLGEALPTAILIVPMLYYEEVYGVIELASFQKFEEHEIKFIEKIAENIAATIAAVQTNEKTRQLLKESQMMSEQFRAQEEELRQNQEELQSTQEEMQRKLLAVERENEMLRKRVD